MAARSDKSDNESKRDFGDSAGYGSGGSTRDYHEVEGEDRVKRPNPLDEVTGGSRDHPAGPHAAPDLTDKEKTPGAGTLPEPGGDNDTDAATG
jgi:hypothetical protein